MRSPSTLREGHLSMRGGPDDQFGLQHAISRRPGTRKNIIYISIYSYIYTYISYFWLFTYLIYIIYISIFITWLPNSSHGYLFIIDPHTYIFLRMSPLVFTWIFWCMFRVCVHENMHIVGCIQPTWGNLRRHIGIQWDLMIFKQQHNG